MQGILANWKTSVLGLFVALMMIAAGAYQGGMTWKQWALAAGVAIWGLMSRDFNITSERSGAK
jgi:hypothetical protein